MVNVTLGKKVAGKGTVGVPLVGVATHWAVKVGGTWYEIPGDENNWVQRSHGTSAASGAAPVGGGLVGTTNKSQAQIDQFINRWLREHPKYDWFTANCQCFSKDFVDFLCDGRAELPMMESGIRGRGVGPNAWSANGDGVALARATTGRSETQHGLARAAAEGPAAGAKAVCGNDGFGAFAKASVGRAEAALGPVGVHVEPNINTGVGVHGGNLEASVLGLGFQVGQDGLGLNTPLGGVKCCTM